MRLSSPVSNQHGVTLIEAVVTIAIMTIGIFATMAMQVKAIDASSTAMFRTEANSLSLSLLETMKQLDFDDANLSVTGDLTLNGNETGFDENSFPELKSQLKHPTGSAQGIARDNSGLTYQVQWDVLEIRENPLVPTSRVLEKTIRIYISWQALLGTNTLQMTTTKYRNITL